MSNMTNTLETHIGGHLFGGTTFPKPSALYVGLLTAASDSEAGTVTEVSGGGYARVATTPGTDWENVSATTWQNKSKLTWPSPTADWGQITHVGIYTDTQANGGELWIVVALDQTQTINSGDPAPFFAAGELTFTPD